MPVDLDVPALTGRRVRLEPLAETHVAELSAAASEERSSFGYTAVPAGREQMERYVRGLIRACRAGVTFPFAQRSLADGKVVGVTRYLTLRMREGERLPYAAEIGGTWLASSAQRTGINAEAKLLLLTYAFEVWSVARVDLKTDARNTRARAAIAAIGASFEGVLRSWQPSQAAGEDLLLRDTAMYSILATEWPAVRVALERRCAV
jgi:RimJ/RimL family protein N-acetyltransferase